MTEKSKGQIAYETDVAMEPNYHDGRPRKKWDALTPEIQANWEKNPTPRIIRKGFLQ